MIRHKNPPNYCHESLVKESSERSRWSEETSTERSIAKLSRRNLLSELRATILLSLKMYIEKANVDIFRPNVDLPSV